MPLGNDIVLDMASTAIAHEQLGADRVSDLLVVSLSAHDYIAHGWGHESWESWDATLRLDVRLAQCLDALDRDIGRNRWAMVVTSDHGGSPLPERVGGGRYTVQHLKEAANTAASLVLGSGTWVARVSYPSIYLSRAALAQPPKELNKAMQKIVFALRSFPGLAIVDRADAYAGGCERRTGDALAICLGLDAERSGDLVFVPAPGWLVHDKHDPVATAHGSLHAYDRDVPVVLLPFGRTPHAPQTGPSGEMSLAEVAPLLRAWLALSATGDARTSESRR
jgi:hypothetical protein